MSACAMHDEYWAPIEPKLRPGGVVFANDPTFTTDITADVGLPRIPATAVAPSLGNPLGGALVMLAASASVTNIVGQDALIDGMRASIPSYRTQQIEANERALRGGWGVGGT